MSFLDRFFGPPNIAKLHKEGKVSDLIKALSHNDENIRLDAERALIDIAETGRTDVIRGLIASGLETPDMRETAIRIIREAPDSTTVDVLMNLLNAVTLDVERLARLSPSAQKEALAGLSWLSEIFIALGTKMKIVKSLIGVYGIPRFERVVEHILASIGDPAFWVVNDIANNDKYFEGLREQATLFMEKLKGPGVKKFVNRER